MRWQGNPLSGLAEAPAGVAGGEQARLRVRTARGDDALAFFDDKWDRLVERQHIPNPMLSAAWLRALAEREPGTPLVVTVSRGGRLLAAGAFGLRGLGRSRWPRIAVWLGDAPLRVTPDMLVDPEEPETGALLDAVLAEAAVLYLGQAPLDGAAARALAGRDHRVHELPSDPAWFAPLTPEQLERPRKEMAYDRRRAAKDADVSIRVASEPQEVMAALERLFCLYRARWQGKSAIPRFAASDEQCAWYRRAVASMAVRGRTRLVEVLEDGELVASALGFVAGRGALFHTTATRRGGQLRSPGKLALLTLAESALAAGAVVIDLGRGSGEPQGPKGMLHPLSRPFARFVVSAAWPAHIAFGASLQARDTLRHVSRRL